ncbi:hypothetical protein GCM10027610_129770 [Dactylosporangium cerinum]
MTQPNHTVLLLVMAMASVFLPLHERDTGRRQAGQGSRFVVRPRRTREEAPRPDPAKLVWRPPPLRKNCEPVLLEPNVAADPDDRASPGPCEPQWRFIDPSIDEPPVTRTG